MRALLSMIEELLDKQAEVVYAPYHRADIRNSLADVSKARRLLGWEPQIALKEGLQKLIDWYLAERSWASQVITE
jgi:nucleoside-diphosphate-sugar epimerase